MLGTWRWNAGFGIAGVGLTVIFSLGNNPISVILMRCIYAFVSFFIIAFIARFVLAIILKPPGIAPEFSDSELADQRGVELDLKTPDESEALNQLLKEQLQPHTIPAQKPVPEPATSGDSNGSNSFKPLSPPQLVSTAGKQPEELAKAVRHLTGE
ncbi:hypothetical protein ACX1C1_20990 [Paenibacillus sp. strain BS8-2]